MTEAFEDDLDVDAGLECEGGPRVRQVVKADAGQTVTGDAPLESVGEVFGMLGAAVGAGEHEVVFGVFGTEEEALLGLAFADGTQRGDGDGVDLDELGLA